MKKYLFVIFSLIACPVFGQYPAHELSFYTGGGFSQLNYDQKSSPKAGGYAGLGYRYYLSGQWSLGTGAEFQLYNSRINLSQINGRSDARDAEGSNFQFRYEAKNYREDQSAFYIAVPLNVQFETDKSSGTSWYINMGGKLAFPVSARYQTKIPTLVTTGYYPEWNVELADPAFMGFGQWNDLRSDKDDFATKKAFLLSAETGIKMHNRFLTYLGVYADYGLNNILTGNNEPAVIGYMTDDPTRFSYKSVTTSLDAEGAPWTRELNLLSLGIKLRFVLN